MSVIQASEMFHARRIASERCERLGYFGADARQLIRKAAQRAKDQPAIVAVGQTIPRVRRCHESDWIPPGAA